MDSARVRQEQRPAAWAAVVPISPPLSGSASDTIPLRQERVFMPSPNEPVSPCVAQDKQPPLATFKTSLRAWRAEYRARLAAQQAPVAGKVENQTAPA